MFPAPKAVTGESRRARASTQTIMKVIQRAMLVVSRGDRKINQVVIGNAIDVQLTVMRSGEEGEEGED